MRPGPALLFDILFHSAFGMRPTAALVRRSLPLLLWRRGLGRGGVHCSKFVGGNSESKNQTALWPAEVHTHHPSAPAASPMPRLRPTAPFTLKNSNRFNPIQSDSIQKFCQLQNLPAWPVSPQTINGQIIPSTDTFCRAIHSESTCSKQIKPN